MNAISPLFTAGAVLALALLSQSVAARGGSQSLDDARDQTRIATTYALSPYLRGQELAVSVRAGQATLTGKVDDIFHRELALQIALTVDGVQEVDNRILVQPGRPRQVTGADRGYGDRIQDATVVAAVTAKLAWSRRTNDLDASIEAVRGAVTLRGTAATAETRALAGRLALNTDGVVSVQNRLLIRRATRGVAYRQPASVRSERGVLALAGTQPR